MGIENLFAASLEQQQLRPNPSYTTQDEDPAVGPKRQSTRISMIEKLPNELLLLIGTFLQVPYDQVQGAHEELDKRFTRLGPRAHKAWATKLAENGILDQLRMAAVNKRFRAVFSYEFWKSAAFTPAGIEDIDDELESSTPSLCMEVAVDMESRKGQSRHKVIFPAMAARPLFPGVTHLVVNMSISADQLAVLDARYDTTAARRAPYIEQFLDVECDLSSLKKLRISCDVILHSIGWEHGSRPIAKDWNLFAMSFYIIVLPSIESARVFWQRRIERLPALRKLEAYRHYPTGGAGGNLTQVSTVREVAGRPELVSQQSIPFTEAVQALQRSDKDMIAMVHEMIRRNNSA